MKKRRMQLFFSMMIMAVLSLSLFSFSASAAQDTLAQNDDAPQIVQTAKSTSTKSSSGITGKTIAIAIGVSVVGTGITVFLIWNSYKTNGQSEPYTYKKNAPLELSSAEDIHVDTIVNRRKIERDNNK